MGAQKVAFHTLGCKLNQLETESIAQAFIAEAFEVVQWGEAADIYLVNTCTVTSMAEQKARRIIRKALKDNPASCVVATGCYAQLDPESLRAAVATVAEAFDSESGEILDRKRLFVVSGDDKAALLDLPRYLAETVCASASIRDALESWTNGEESAPSAADPLSRFRFDAADFSFHSRASLKIQDGCDNSCAYCRVRLARGKSVSLAADIVLSRLRELEGRGYSEAVLTGINVSRYFDAEAGLGFPGLIRLLLAGTARISLRISSTEPDGVDEDFADAVSDPRVRPHFHLSVQSGSDAILKRMRRRYRAEAVERAAVLLRTAKKDPFLACDLIAGFPGEGAEDFRDTLALCGRIGFAWIHAFPFSPRPGTEAMDMLPRIPERIAAERAEVLGALARSGHDAYAARWAGREVNAVAEAGKALAAEAAFPALSENYLKLLVRPLPDQERPHPGASIRCRIDAVLSASDMLDAELLEIFH
ncbi:MAG: tRNA (N(6)-L-threonylcarbamoyladenosine(37)-C(2))-methylthiotransferase MtaB [Treponema sp. GWB1_62_6]|nr:MAG: tRNA (N(6)-L-threonylcarbamoyladenosine(37)-C(2))-methylthiotransferase MtaB [Treponema sp. GWA1_62_8]OHE66935.1 MAG: tRNA (N(6)-L-threonylcarbamoyladenosine(37)-C(2))-methylthiotransferase MtaB [Treponema sp. GWC1_61_84]OHE67979.1 MAG: tRNA (N(6)-L-threonylcarbamoyladenosine(37)-C(2))-methylthiotransferase MtaB [Treponema sp. RIFOXYC1_FULL_61_9]OHE70110.1 MAG: tRNA (N(6)-L-threonylcarbamoyladenosine(37)-C(2))-methylthiotransferase MtaB [Treponema sp. GWB1_62_6]HCM25516.1 tRNA (N(6)-L-t